MLGQHRRRWANVKSTLFQRLVLAGSDLMLEVEVTVVVETKETRLSQLSRSS